ncbi:MAG: kynureninase [Phycisphaerales bacterium]
MSAMTTATHPIDEAHASLLDDQDPLAEYRERFYFPTKAGKRVVYLTGNSLGLQPKAVKELVNQELEDWADLAVNAHFEGRDPWKDYHEQFRGPLSRLVGAKESEVVAMNSLTVNLHLLMASFYTPTDARYKIVIEDNAFPSDSYAVGSQAQFHGREIEDAIIRLRPRQGEHTLRTDDVCDLIRAEGESIALVMIGGVNYLTGQLMDMQTITRIGRDAGCIVGWDLAHAMGNVPIKLHEWGADFAAWCSYKYLNSGPGAVAGAFVHERHHRTDRPRFAGWWGNDPKTRFRMGPDFVPEQSADAWQLSNPPILGMTPIKASLAIFDEIGIDRLREKSLRITGYMESLIRQRCGDRVTILTPEDPTQRGSQLSLVVEGNVSGVRDLLEERGVVADFREPNVIRAAPVPTYVSYHDVWRFVDVLAELVEKANA